MKKKKEFTLLEQCLIHAVAFAAQPGQGYGGRTRSLKEAEIRVLRDVRTFLLGRGNLLADDYDEEDYVRRVKEHLGEAVIRDSPEREQELEDML
jgi:hypothetical protein